MILQYFTLVALEIYYIVLEMISNYVVYLLYLEYEGQFCYTLSNMLIVIEYTDFIILINSMCVLISSWPFIYNIYIYIFIFRAN